MNLSHQNNSVLSAGFSFCAITGRVKFRDCEQKLNPTNTKVLFCLLENSAKVISRSELFSTVWPNQEISDDTLTRALSDIRTLLKNMSGETNLIETYPKRGYGWMHSVDAESESYSKPAINTKDNVDNGRRWTLREVFLWTVGGLLTLWLMAVVALWSLDKLIQPDLVRVALIQLQSKPDESAKLQLQLDEMLKQAILKTNKIRYLSDLTSQSGAGKPYPYLSREFLAQWVIEVQLRKNHQNIKLTLTLVDAKTAIVYDTLSTNVEDKPKGLTTFVDEFVALIPVKND